MSFNAKQEKFCQEYLIDRNATQASIRAGYSKKTAQQIGSKLLLKVVIQERIAELTSKQSKRTEINADFVLKGLVKVYKNSAKLIPDYINGKKKNSKGMRNAQAANKSLELLGRHFSMFTDKTELTGKGGSDLLPQREKITRKMSPDEARAAFEKSISG